MKQQWQRLKRKYWDKSLYENDPNSPVVFIGFVTPWPRRMWEEHQARLFKLLQWAGGILGTAWLLKYLGP